MHAFILLSNKALQQLLYMMAEFTVLLNDMVKNLKKNADTVVHHFTDQSVTASVLSSYHAEFT